MKNKILRIMVLAIIITIIAIPKFEFSANKLMIGDINGDNSIDIRDLLMMSRHILAVTKNVHNDWQLEGEQFESADVTNNGKIDTSDMLALLRYIAAKNDPDNIGNKHQEWLDLGSISKDEDTDVLNTKKESTIQLKSSANQDDTEESKTDNNSNPESENNVIQDEEDKRENNEQEINQNNNEVNNNDYGEDKIINVEKINLNKTDIEIEKGKTETITATIEPSDATNKEIIWSSSNQNIATVDTNGTVTAKANGNATIIAKSNDVTASCKVIVKTTPTGISLSLKNNVSLEVGKWKYLFVNFTPNTSTENNIDWTNSNQAVVAVEKIIENGTYYIKTAIDENKVLSVENSSKDNSAKIQLFDKSDKMINSQKFEITNKTDGYYRIIAKHSGKAIDVKGAGKTKGTLIQQYNSNNSDAQTWEFEYAGGDSYYIKSKCNGLYLDVNGGKATNGTQLQMWTGNRSNAQKFKLELIEKKPNKFEDGTYLIKSAIDEKKVIDVKGGSKENKAKIQIWNNNGSEAQKFEILNIGNGYYVVRAQHSGKVLDVSGGGKTKGTKIQQYSFNGSDAQIWKIESAGEDYYYLKSKHNGLYLDISGGKVTNGVQLQVWTGNKSKAQKFKLEKIDNTLKYTKMGVALIKPKTGGTAKITAKTSSGKTASINIKSIKKVKVVFKANGGNGGGTQTFTYGVKNQKFNVKTSRTGFTLNKWNTKADGSGTNYNINNTVSDSWINNSSLTVTLYAKWKVNKFKNPLMYGADPFVYQKDGYYYYIRSTGNGIQIYKTKMLNYLTQSGGKVVYRGGSIWAPELHYFNNHWYIYAAIAYSGDSSRRMYVLESKTSNPLGKYKMIGKITSPDNKWAIDGTVLDYNNKLYFIWSGWPGYSNGVQNLYIARMSSPTKISGGRVCISTPTKSWETYGWPDVNEGPQILKHNGKVYVIYSASGSWTSHYCLGMLKLNGDPMKGSSWTKSGPVFSSGNGVYGPGHACFVKSPDGKEDWIVYHANTRLVSEGDAWWGDRRIFIQKFTWNKNGTPNFGKPLKTSTNINPPSGTK